MSIICARLCGFSRKRRIYVVVGFSIIDRKSALRCAKKSGTRPSGNRIFRPMRPCAAMVGSRMNGKFDKLDRSPDSKQISSIGGFRIEVDGHCRAQRLSIGCDSYFWVNRLQRGKPSNRGSQPSAQRRFSRQHLANRALASTFNRQVPPDQKIWDAPNAENQTASENEKLISPKNINRTPTDFPLLTR